MANGIDSCNGMRFRIRWKIDILFNTASSHWREHQSFTLCEISYHCTIYHSPFVYCRTEVLGVALCTLSRMRPPSSSSYSSSCIHYKTWDIFSTWVEEDDRSEASQLRLIHLHLPHLGDEFCEDAVEDGADAGAVCAVAVDVKTGGEQDAVFDLDGAMWECCDQQLIPA